MCKRREAPSPHTTCNNNNSGRQRSGHAYDLNSCLFLACPHTHFLYPTLPLHCCGWLPAHLLSIICNVCAGASILKKKELCLLASRLLHLPLTALCSQSISSGRGGNCFATFLFAFYAMSMGEGRRKRKDTPGATRRKTHTSSPLGRLHALHAWRGRGRGTFCPGMPCLCLPDFPPSSLSLSLWEEGGGTGGQTSPHPPRHF